MSNSRLLSILPSSLANSSGKILTISTTNLIVTGNFTGNVSNTQIIGTTLPGPGQVTKTMLDVFSSSGVGGTLLPSGATEQRPIGASNGAIRFNTTVNYFEYFSQNTWNIIATPPILVSISPSSFDGSSNTTFTLNGSLFDSGAVASFITSNNVSLAASTTVFNNPSQLSATVPRNILASEGPLSVLVVNNSGLSTLLTGCVTTGSSPLWVTSSGSIGTCYDANRSGYSISVSASDPDNQAVTYTLVSGSLPTNMSLNTSSGLISGTPNAVVSDTTYSFTLRATDSVGNSIDRNFSITIKAPVIVTYGYTGGIQTFTLPSGATKFTSYMWGAGGGSSRGGGGGGGYTYGTVTTSSGSSFAVMVGGGGGSRGPDAGSSGNAYGFGGATGTSGFGAGGGGLSGIFTGTSGVSYTDQARAILVAGGGGGGDWDNYAQGGAGGGTTGQSGWAGGGSQSGAGAGYGGNNGSYMYGGTASGGDGGGGAGGGGGYYGGGAGNGDSGGSGGGGSGYIGGASGASISGGSTTAGSSGTPGGTGSTYYANSAGYGGGYSGRVVIVY